MERCRKIYNHPLYQKLLKNINDAEKDRIFCLHGTEHSLDTARIAYILCLEEKADIDKEIIYAAALLHDIGRYGKKPHHEASAEAAETIMRDCGFSEAETALVKNAVLAHRSGGKNGLCDILYRADKLSRACFMCKAQKNCYWAENKRNNMITV